MRMIVPSILDYETDKRTTVLCVYLKITETFLVIDLKRRADTLCV